MNACRLPLLLAAVCLLTACEPIESPDAVGTVATSGAVAAGAPGTTATSAVSSPRPTATTPPPTEPSTEPSPKPSTKPASPAPKSPLLAVVGVTDGDTIKVRVGGVTERVRVIGIDTPELAGGECYAQKAASRMQSLVQSRSVRLVADPTQDDRDRYDRLLRHVRLADGRSVAELLIAGGFGREYTYDRAYRGQAAHLAAQASATKARLGIWGSACAAGAPVPLTTPKPKGTSPASCLIKGNISSEGEKIYHVPGQQFYDVTKISQAKGERWFCSEADAVSAGWRRSQR